MKKIIIKNLAGVQTHYAEMVDPSAWISECVANNSWGKPERWIPASEPHDPADVIESEAREIAPAMAAVIDEEGKEVSPAVGALMEQWVKLKAEYTVEIVDVSAEYALAEVIAKRKAEYPSPEEFLNAYFDGGDAAVQLLNAKRQAVKAKYPKPGA